MLTRGRPRKLRNKKEFNTFKIVHIALLIAMATVVHAVEKVLPGVPVPIPGVKLGLANILTLVTLNIFGFTEGFTVAILRTLLAGILTGIFGPTFILSMSGAIFSTLVMGGTIKLFRKYVSNIGVSIIGAIAHNVAQLFTASIILDNIFFFSYLPWLLAFAIPTGIFVGITTDLLIKVLRKSIKLQEN